MADVLEDHPEPVIDGGYWYCPCGHDYGVGPANSDVAAHQSAALSSAGFGPVQERADLKRLRGELKTIGKNLDSWESQDHTNVTIRYVRRCLQSLNAAAAERGGQ